MRYTYHLARYQAGLARAVFSHALDRLRPLRVRDRDLPWHLVAFSSRSDVPEQVASLRSLHRHVGRPRSTTVVGDGSHGTSDANAFAAFADVRLVDWQDFARPDLPSNVRRYAHRDPLGKKLAVLASLPPVPVLYADSDVLFFPEPDPREGASIFGAGSQSWYLRDTPRGLEREYLTPSERMLPPANAGFFLVSEPLDFDPLLARVPDDGGMEAPYLEQTLVHLALHRSGAQPLPSERFVLTFDDQFLYRDPAVGRAFMRHYVSSVRHKFWLAVPRVAI